MLSPAVVYMSVHTILDTETNEGLGNEVQQKL